MLLAHVLSLYPPGSSGVVYWTVLFPITRPYCVCPSKNQYLCPLLTMSFIVLILASHYASSAPRMFMSPCHSPPIIFVINLLIV